MGVWGMEYANAATRGRPARASDRARLKSKQTTPGAPLPGAVPSYRSDSIASNAIRADVRAIGAGDAGSSLSKKVGPCSRSAVSP